jgi:hypothetical protein
MPRHGQGLRQTLSFAKRQYELAQVWSYAGEWVHAFLYKKFGYQLVSPPVECGNCDTSCAITLNPTNPSNSQVVTITVTVTNMDGSASKGEAPDGTVVISVDGSTLATLTLPDNEPDSQNSASVSTNWTASCTPGAYHTISATYTPSETDFASTSCSAGVTVTGCGITTSCCPSVSVPETLYATITNADNCNGTYTLTYDGSIPGWSLSFPGGWGNCNPTGYLILKCTSSGWTFQSQGNINPTNPSSVSCSPFQLVFSATDDCCGSFPHPVATYTVTE